MAKRLEANGLWESSRMMLPEHRETLASRREFGTVTKAKSNKRPTRDEFELEDLGNQLVEAHQEEYEVVLTVWNREDKLRGRIEKLDAQTRLVHVSRLGEITKVPFLDIIQVSRPD